jgi:hypothetical protein
VCSCCCCHQLLQAMLHTCGNPQLLQLLLPLLLAGVNIKL